MDNNEIAWGTQYEIARGVSSGRWLWTDVTDDKLRQLRGNNRDTAYRVPFVFGVEQNVQDMNSSLWYEYCDAIGCSSYDQATVGPS